MYLYVCVYWRPNYNLNKSLILQIPFYKHTQTVHYSGKNAIENSKAHFAKILLLILKFNKESYVKFYGLMINWGYKLIITAYQQPRINAHEIIVNC